MRRLWRGSPLPLLAALALVAVAIAGERKPATGADGRIGVVAAEDFYGEVSAAIGGDAVAVTSILSNPDQDPHLFEASPSVARALASAKLVILNGADYDPWVGKLLAASPSPERAVISVAELLGRKAGDNPHLWYDPTAMPKIAAAITARLAEIDPAHRSEFESRRQAFNATLQPLLEKIAAIRTHDAGQPVTATEPVFGYMAAALGLAMRNERFQLAVMNDTEPSARDTAAFEDDLRQHRVKALLYNSQVTDPQTERLVEIAGEAGVPVVGVTETKPAGKSYVEWMTGQLDALDRALAGPSS